MTFRYWLTGFAIFIVNTIPLMLIRMLNSDNLKIRFEFSSNIQKETCFSQCVSHYKNKSFHIVCSHIRLGQINWYSPSLYIYIYVVTMYVALALVSFFLTNELITEGYIILSIFVLVSIVCPVLKVYYSTKFVLIWFFHLWFHISFTPFLNTITDNTMSFVVLSNPTNISNMVNYYMCKINLINGVPFKGLKTHFRGSLNNKFMRNLLTLAWLHLKLILI